ncbi:hypothetical protein HA402_012803 [Bradysia odoriphaga]|nr:hypothetical protein HA402_012803 [Bradysia odoriphaga]
MNLSFSLNEKKYSITPKEVPIDTSLLVFIRSHARLTGTKFMCLEDGCGACIVNISGVKTPSGESRTIAVNACLWPVYACNNLTITTIEGIGDIKNGYHPIQRVLHRFNGTQCGYCSPGMVMNMYSLLESNSGKVTMEQVENSFGGSLCRCTGYRSILDAFKSLATNGCGCDIEDLPLNMCRKCDKECDLNVNASLEIVDEGGKMWLRPSNLSELLAIMTKHVTDSEYMLVAGNTAHGVYRRSEQVTVFIDIKSIRELHTISVNENSFVVGANVSLTELMETLQQAATKYDHYSYGKHLADHIDLVATVPVRNAGTIAGNLSLKHAHNEFPSDIFLLLETIGSKLNILSVDGSEHSHTAKEYLTLDMRHKVILTVAFPKLEPSSFEFRSYKIMQRAQNAHAIVNAAFLFEFKTNETRSSVKSCRICYGGISPRFVHADVTEIRLAGVEDLYTNESLERAIESLKHEINPDSNPLDPPAEYRKHLAMALFYRFMLAAAPLNRIKIKYLSGSLGLERPISSGSQVFQPNQKTFPLTQPVLKYEGLIQCSGEAEYVNDVFSALNVKEELWAAFVSATQVHSKIVSIDATKALKMTGVEAFFSAKDIPGENDFAPIGASEIVTAYKEPIFVDVNSEIEFHGQPCGIIVAKTMNLANLAAKEVEIVYDQLEVTQPIAPTVFHWRDRYNCNAFQAQTEEFRLSPNQKRISVKLKHQKVIIGNLDIGSQYHFTMEPQTTVCHPNDDGGINVWSAAQFFDLTHIAISRSLKIPQSKVTGIHKRLGGGYGAKLTRSSQVACACALACHLLRRPVRFVMTIESNMSVIGKRYANLAEYNATIDTRNGFLLNLKLSVAQDFGNSRNDDSSLVVESTLARSCYARVSEWMVTLYKQTTNAPSATWCRGPGSTEATAIVENLMEHIARETNLDPAQVRLNNFSKQESLRKIFPDFLRDTEYYKRKAEINAFNQKNRWKKKGIAVSVIKFPLDYMASLSVYIAIYHGDGTVVVSHGGTEMGQGINTKVQQVVAFVLDIPLNYVTIAPFSSIVAANRSFSAASITSDSVCFAAKKACENILKRLKPVRKRMSHPSWVQIVQQAWSENIDLTQKELLPQTELKSYSVVGCACAEIELDVLTGNVQILRVDIVEDVGNSMSPLVDIGQIEGAFIMGVGYWLTEKLIYDGQTGELLTNRTWTYKVPGAKDIPIDFRVKFLQNVNNEGVFGSKTTGEPALTLSIVVVFALRHAIDSVRLDNGLRGAWYQLGSGNTPDVVSNASNVCVDEFKLY